MSDGYAEQHMKSITIAAARPSELPAVLALLEQSGLPQDGLSEHLATTVVARDGDAVVGSAALEIYGGAALLRSVAVDAGLRGQGLGQRLTRAALDLARDRGVATVYLLTETAADFFPRFGFQLTERAAVDPAVQQSVEFISACPASAQVLVASLSGA
jgi:amino-acid N-acetyltransferase